MTETRHAQRSLFLGLILLSVAARFALLRGNMWRLSEDVDDYLRLAENLVDYDTFGSGTYPSAFRPPLYPLLLAPYYWLQRALGLDWSWRLTAITFLHVGLGVATTLITYRVASRLSLARVSHQPATVATQRVHKPDAPAKEISADPSLARQACVAGEDRGPNRWAVLAAFLVAVDPLLLHHARLPMTETLAAFLFALTLDLLIVSDTRPGVVRTLLAGLVLGLAMLCRTTFWSFAVLATLAALWFRPAVTRDRVRVAGSIFLVALAVQLPWGIRNWVAVGRPVLTTTHGGYTLLLGNNHVFYDEVVRTSWGRAWPGERLSEWQAEVRSQVRNEAGDVSELEYDRFCYHHALATIRSRPGDFWRSVGYRLVSLWRVAPLATESFSDWLRLGCAAFYVPELLLVIIGLTDRRVWQWPGMLLPTALVSFTAVHALYWSDMRMRAAIMPAVAILAALGAARVARHAAQVARSPD